MVGEGRIVCAACEVAGELAAACDVVVWIARAGCADVKARQGGGGRAVDGHRAIQDIGV